MLYSCQEVFNTLKIPYLQPLRTLQQRITEGVIMERKNYTIQQLSDILGVSVAAIRKKIKPDENNPDIKRYKKRYPIVFGTYEDREVMQISLTDIELEEEKRLSGINKIKHSSENNVIRTCESNVIETVESCNSEVIDIPYTKSDKDNTELIINLTERYNNELKTYAERIIEAESKQLLLEDKANREGFYLQEIKDAKNVTKNVVKYFSITLVVMLLLLVGIRCFLIYKLMNPTIIEKQVVKEKPVIQQVPVPVKKAGRK